MRQLVHATRQLATMVQVGMPLVRALDLLAQSRPAQRPPQRPAQQPPKHPGKRLAQRPPGAARAAGSADSARAAGAAGAARAAGSAGWAGSAGSSDPAGSPDQAPGGGVRGVLATIRRSLESPDLAASFAAVRDGVAGGRSLAASFEAHPRAFSALYVGMVEAGEAGGALDEVLERLADMLERRHALRRTVMGALIYPAVVLAVSAVAVGVLMAFVIPTFEQMFAASDLPLPLPTRLVIGASQALRSAGPGLVLGLVALVAGGRYMARTPRGRRHLDRAALRLPGVGAVLRAAATARFTRTLATLLGSGVPLLEALTLTARTAGNQAVTEALIEARERVAAGLPLAAALSTTDALPGTVAQMVHVGEQTGALPELLGRVATAAERDVDDAVSALTAALEPVLIVLLGAVVGGMIIAMYLPIFDMVGAVG